jgi:diphthamide biosynthesis protein 4
MEQIETDEGSKWKAPCRCSGEYTVGESELEVGQDVIGCSACSLYIQVLYDIEECSEQD